MSEVKVNKISPRSGTEVTLGDSGDTFTIPSGATINNQGTATNFGATGSASWVTTVKTGDFTAVAGEGYFVNSTSGEIDVTLPAGSAGDVVAVADYANTADTNNIILKQNGSDKIEGSTDDFVINVEGAAITLVFVDSTKGWITTDTGQSGDASVAKFITATGGTITTVCTNFKVHTFTGPGTFCVSCAGSVGGSNTVDYLVVAAGGGGGGTNGGAGGGSGAGAGGYRESPGAASGCYSVSPLGAAPAAALPVSVQGYSIVVGSGGSAGAAVPGAAAKNGGNGNNSSFSTITSTGGGGGRGGPCGSQDGAPGGSGGGASGGDPAPRTAGAGNTPPVSPSQGSPGGSHTQPTGKYNGSGGGGATAAGTGVEPSNTNFGTGGAGATSSINGSPVTRSAGAPGGSYPPSGPAATPGSAGSANSGNGGQGATGAPGSSPSTNPGGTGGSGIVIIRYKFQ